MKSPNTPPNSPNATPTQHEVEVVKHEPNLSPEVTKHSSDVTDLYERFPPELRIMILQNLFQKLCITVGNRMTVAEAFKNHVVGLSIPMAPNLTITGLVSGDIKLFLRVYERQVKISSEYLEADVKMLNFIVQGLSDGVILELMFF